MKSHPLFEIVTTTAGVISIRNKAVNEIMHNPVGPWIEANALYVDQSHLEERLRKCAPGEELVLFDVGLGAAANALAALHCAKNANSKAKLRLISFERDLDLLHFALAHADLFAHFAGYESAIETLLKEGRWESETIVWELRHGDFLNLIPNEPTRANLIFFDPYSPQVNIDMWTVNSFRLLREKCSEEEGRKAILYTYSQATPIRAALLAAGFYIGAGISTGLKNHTTQAALDPSDLDEPFDGQWLERWKRSQTPYPLGSQIGELEEIESKILSHPQFT